MSEKQKLLIVDDSELNRDILKEILGSSYDYLEAENGTQAIQILEVHPEIDLMLLDINMPQMNGFQVLEHMRELQWIDEVPVVMISSEESVEIMRKAYHLTEADIALIITASSLHDIGKVSIPEEILNKPGRLTDEEFKIMKSHSEIGASMIRDMDFPQDKPLVRIAWEICRWHHERWDGRGYPDGLKGEEIPISAQIVSIADVYDALTSVRCYKNAYDHDTAIQMILEGQCGQFNPLLLECLKEISPQLSRTFKKEKDDNREYYEAQRISEEILRQNALPSKDHSQRVIEIMQEKIKFFKENSGKISMEYNAISGNLVLTDGESQKEYQRDNLEFDLYGAYDISEEDIQRVKDSLDSVTSENKEISMKVMLKVRGERQMCDLKLHTLWSSLKTDGYIGIVGQLDIVK